MVANEAVAGTNVMLAAADAVIANELDTAFCAQLLVPSNVPVNDPVNEPVLICAELDTVPEGNTVGAYDAVVANELDTAFCAQLLVPTNTPVKEPLNDPVFICAELDTVPFGNIVGAYEAEVANEAVVGMNVILVAALDVMANELDTALVAQLLVPTNCPVNDPVKLPVLI